MLLTQKICRGCFEKKPRAEFGARAHTYDGISSRCKVCVASAKAAHIAKSGAAKKVQKYNSTWYKSYRAKNPEKYKEWGRKNRRREVDELTNSYISKCMGLPVSLLDESLINTKREQLKLFRLSRDLTNVIIRKGRC